MWGSEFAPKFWSHLPPRSDLTLSLSRLFCQDVIPPNGSILTKFKSYKLYLLVIGHILVLKNPLNGIKPIKKIIRVELTLKLRNFYLEVQVGWPCMPIPSRSSFFLAIVTSLFLIDFFSWPLGLTTRMGALNLLRLFLIAWANCLSRYLTQASFSTLLLINSSNLSLRVWLGVAMLGFTRTDFLWLGLCLGLRDVFRLNASAKESNLALILLDARLISMGD